MKKQTSKLNRKQTNIKANKQIRQANKPNNKRN